LSITWQFVHAVLENDHFSKHISQDRVATRLRCGGIFSYHFVGNLSQSLTMKEFENRLRFDKVIDIC